MLRIYWTIPEEETDCPKIVASIVYYPQTYNSYRNRDMIWLTRYRLYPGSLGGKKSFCIMRSIIIVILMILLPTDAYVQTKSYLELFSDMQESPPTELERYLEGVGVIERIIARKNWDKWEYIVHLVNQKTLRQLYIRGFSSYEARKKGLFLTVTEVRGLDRNFPGNFAEAALALSP